MATRALVPANGSRLPNSERVWTREQLAFMLWLALPEATRFPRTQKALASQLKKHEITLVEWKHLPGFSSEVVSLVRDLIKTDDIARVFYAMVKEAELGNVAAARLVLEATGSLEPGGVQGERKVQIVIINGDINPTKKKRRNGQEPEEELNAGTVSIFDD